jgi:hypothetical protein
MLVDCYLDAMRGLSRCDEPKSDAGGSIATGRSNLVGKVDGEH